MKIGVFYPVSKTTVWSLGKGICTTLENMGHSASDASSDDIPLEDKDIIIVSGPEYLHKRIRERYPRWDSLKATKFGWLHETVDREDYNTNPIAVNGKLPVEELKALTDNLITPAAQDEAYGMRFVPFGVDTNVFRPTVKTNIVLFIGSLYEKRRNLLRKYPATSVRDGHDFLMYKYDVSFEDYLNLTSRAATVLNLPTLSRTNGTRVYEALACRAFTITPNMGGSDRNYSMFRHKEHLMYYEDSPVDALNYVETTTHSTKSGNYTTFELNSEGKRIAENGYREVISIHRLDQRLTEILGQRLYDSEKSTTNGNNGTRRIVSGRTSFKQRL